MRRYRLRFVVIDRDGNTVDVFESKREAKAARDKLEMEGARFAHPSFRAPARTLPAMVQERDTEDSEWRNYHTVDTPEELEKALRLIGYGNNQRFYRLIDLPDNE